MINHWEMVYGKGAKNDIFGFASKKYHPIDDLDADAWKALNLRR